MVLLPAVSASWLSLNPVYLVVLYGSDLAPKGSLKLYISA